MTRPGGSRPLSPEVRTRSPTSKPGVIGRKLSSGSALLSPSRMAWSPERSTTTGIFELKSVIRRTRALRVADADDAAGHALRRHRGHALAHAAIGTGIDQQGVQERAARVGHDARRGPGRCRLDRGHVEHLAQGTVLDREAGRLGLPGEQAAVLLAQALVLVIDRQELAEMIEAPAGGDERLVDEGEDGCRHVADPLGDVAGELHVRFAEDEEQDGKARPEAPAPRDRRRCGAGPGPAATCSRRYASERSHATSRSCGKKRYEHISERPTIIGASLCHHGASAAIQVRL